MVNFFGEYKVTLDTKNRVMVPARFRELSGGIQSWVLTRGLDRCLALYTPERFDELVQKIHEVPFTKKKAREFQRLLLSKSVSVDLDKTGRILVPEYLKELGRLDKKTVFVGVADRIEIWDEDTWTSMQNNISDDFESLAEDLFS